MLFVKSFLDLPFLVLSVSNFRLSSTKLGIKWFLIKKPCKGTSILGGKSKFLIKKRVVAYFKFWLAMYGKKG